MYLSVQFYRSRISIEPLLKIIHVYKYQFLNLARKNHITYATHHSVMIKFIKISV